MPYIGNMKGQLVVADSERITSTGNMSNLGNIEHATDRKVRMLRAGIRNVDVSRSLKVDKGLVSRVINGTKRSRRIESHIANLLKTPRSQLWPPHR